MAFFFFLFFSPQCNPIHAKEIIEYIGLKKNIQRGEKCEQIEIDIVKIEISIWIVFILYPLAHRYHREKKRSWTKEK